MEYIAIDTETCLIGYPDQVNPDLVVVSYCDKKSKGLLKHDQAFDCLNSWFTRASKGHLKIIGANISFDLCVLIKAYPTLEPLIWKAIKRGMISDIQVREKLYLISTVGRHNSKRSNLGSMVERYFDIEIEGKDGDAWRFRYNELMDVPLEDWPKEAVDYAVDDAVWTLKLWEAQESKRTVTKFGSMNSEEIQVAAAFSLRLMSVEGICINQEDVNILRADVEGLYNIAVDKLKKAGIINEEGKRSQQKVKALAEKVGVTAKTDKGNTKTDKKTLEKHRGKDPVLDSYLNYSEHMKAVTTFIPQMSFPRIHPQFNAMVSTLRTSCFSSNYYKYKGESYGKRVIKRGDPVPSVNLQQIPRDKRFRKPFVPDKGHVFIDSDYTSLELICFAQTCYDLFGYSDMMDAINEGQNLHDTTGTAIFNATYKEEVSPKEFHKLIVKGDKRAKESRQIAKVVNLGIPGGQGKITIMRTARLFGLDPTLKDVDNWVQIAKGRFREFTDYFKWLRRQEYKAGFFAVEVSSVWLANRRYTEAANCKGMQTLGALGAKLALVKIVRACRDYNKGSILLGSSCKAAIHDEFLLSTPDCDIINKCREKARLMLEGLSTLMPDLRVSCTVDVQDYWAKEATPNRPAFEFTYYKGEFEEIKR